MIETGITRLFGQVSGVLSKETTEAEIVLELEANYKKAFEKLQTFKLF